jgi:capsular polysaccharide transport system ATP-binding protein
MDRISGGTVIMVSHAHDMLKDYCDYGAVLANGRLVFYDSLAEAADAHDRIMKS